MELVQAVIDLFPELLKLGGWGALIVLFLTRRIITRGERDDAQKVADERVADKDRQIAMLTKAVHDGDAAMDKLAVAWDAAIKIIMRQREEQP